MKIVPISLPTPFYIGPVNVYLIPEDPITLIDTGPKTKEAVDTLRAALRSEGLSVADIRRIVLTHAHEDHCGLARALRDEAKNAEVLVHYADSLDDGQCSELTDEAELEFDSGALQVVHTPGHTPGSCSFIRHADRTLIAGDCVLKRITPNPILSPDPIDRSRRFRSLEEYLVSLARVRALAPTLVLGGHGDAVHDYEELFHRYLRAIRDRQSQIIRLVPTNGASAWEVSRAMFPGTDDVHRFLGVSEAVAHLDYAQSEGKLALELSDGREVYRKIS